MQRAGFVIDHQNMQRRSIQGGDSDGLGRLRLGECGRLGRLHQQRGAFAQLIELWQLARGNREDGSRFAPFGSDLVEERAQVRGFDAQAPGFVFERDHRQGFIARTRQHAGHQPRAFEQSGELQTAGIVAAGCCLRRFVDSHRFAEQLVEPPIRHHPR